MTRIPLRTKGAIKLQGLAIEMLAIDWNETGVSMVVKMPDRDTGVMGSAMYSAPFSQPPADETELASLIIRAVTVLLSHEVAENIYVEGQRVWDPHREDAELFFQ